MALHQPSSRQLPIWRCQLRSIFPEKTPISFDDSSSNVFVQATPLDTDGRIGSESESRIRESIIDGNAM
ncbi:unnamed protein product [Cuscuta europaea]|uniref:Uncharacterized protein n=1 Tax=Cuscuta europaea TaxID=41803 RepID=A0A9P1EH96_CUSEU|nr:unnamed protein product [Cuscuta europaea]